MRQPTPTPERLLELVAKMQGQPVLMLVDLVADRFISGVPKRISREAPVLILRFEREELLPGGGANSVANVAALGGRPIPLGFVGPDSNGEGLIRALEELGVATGGIRVRRGYRTPTKTRILGGGRHAIKQQIVRYDIEDRLELAEEDFGFFAAQANRWRHRCGVALLSDYGYGTVTPQSAAEMRRNLGDGAAVICDSRFRLGEFSGLDGATPNEEEAETLLGAPMNDDPGRLKDGGRELLRRLGARFLLITRGSCGMSLCLEGGIAHLPVHGTHEVADVTGAGDTVIGTIGLALAAGASPLEAALLSNYAGGVVVMKRGTATLSRVELEEALRSDTTPLEELVWDNG